ncbi:MAG: hypothetical protein ACPGLV_15135 [Bacteroidia bacterium]
MCEPKTYQNISETNIELIQKELAEDGHNITGNNPWDITIKKGPIKIGLKATWSNDNETLTIDITKKPMMIGCDMVWNELDKLLQDL